MKNLGILGSEFFFFALTSRGKTRQSISSCVSLVLAIIDSEMVTREFLGPVDLPGTLTLGILRSAEIIMISRHKNFEFAPL